MIGTNSKFSKALSFFNNKSNQGNENLNLHMFKEDLYQGIMPIGARTDYHPEFQVKLEGKNSDYNKVMNLLKSMTRRSHGSVSEQVCDFVESIGFNLVQNGQAFFEIVRGEDESASYYLNSFTSEPILKLHSYYIQYIPKKFNVKKRVVFMHRDKVWKVRMVEELGGVKGFKKTLDDLEIHDPLGPYFLKENLSSFKKYSFNLSEYFLKLDIYIQRTTRKFGWDKRGDSHKTEFYFVYQKVKMAWAKALLRIHIISELNYLFQSLDIDCKIIVSGIPEPKDLLSTLQKLHEGKISFQEAMDMTVLL